jgi:PST family polysaccharide transporter
MGLTFLSTGVMARLLSPAEFGVMAAAMVVIALTDAVFDGAFGIGIVQKEELSDDYIATTLTLSVLLATGMFAVIALSAKAIQGFFGFPGLAAVLTVTAITLLLKAFGSVSRALLIRRQRYHNLAITTVVTYVAGYCLTSPLLALAGAGVWALVGGALVATATEAAINLAFARTPLKPTIRRADVREVFSSSGLFTLTRLLNWASSTGANAVVGRTMGAEALGLYSRGTKLLEIATSATAQPLQRVLFPAFARLQNDPPAARAALLRALALAVPFFAILSAALAIHARAIILIVLGPKWVESVPIAQILFLALVPRCTYKISESLAFGFGRSASTAIRQGFFALLAIAGPAIAAPYGAPGVAAAAALAIYLFYLSSVGYAAALVKLEARILALVHLRALMLALLFGFVDMEASKLSGGLGFWPAQLIGAAAGGLVIAALFMWGPSSWIGTAIADLRQASLKFVRRLTTSASRSPA